MNKLIKVGDGYVPLADYMAELRETINDDTEVIKTFLIVNNDTVTLHYKDDIHASISYSGDRVRMYLWWYRQGDSMPIDKRGLYLADNINAWYDAQTILNYIRHYARALAVAKEKLDYGLTNK